MSQHTAGPFLSEVRAASDRLCKPAALFVIRKEGKPLDCHEIRESVHHVYGFVDVGDQASLEQVLAAAKGVVHLVVLDLGLLNGWVNREKLIQDIGPKGFTLFSYEGCWAQSLEGLLLELFKREDLRSVLVAGESFLRGPALALCKTLPIELTESTDKNVDLVLALSLGKPCLTDGLPAPKIAVDAGIGSIPESLVTAWTAAGTQVLRLSNRASLSSQLIMSLETRDLFDNVLGELSYQGIRMVAGGLMGLSGDVAVDNISKPTTVLGVCSGGGHLLSPPYSAEHQDHIDKVLAVIRAGARSPSKKTGV